MANNDGLIIAGLAHYVNTHRMNWMKVLGHGVAMPLHMAVPPRNPVDLYWYWRGALP